MAVIEALPHPEIIRAFKGTLDFYYWRGLYCVRSWPRSPAMPRSPASTATANEFRDIIRNVTRTAQPFHNAALEQTANTAWTWRDELVAGLYGSLITEPTPAPPPTSEETMYLRLKSSQNLETFNVNSTSDIFHNVLTFPWPTLPFTPTQYRLTIRGTSNAGFQTINCTLKNRDNSDAPFGDGSSDLAVPNANDIHFGSLRPFINTPTTPGEQCAIGLRGSNTTVDLLIYYVDLELIP